LETSLILTTTTTTIIPLATSEPIYNQPVLEFCQIPSRKRHAEILLARLQQNMSTVHIAHLPQTQTVMTGSDGPIGLGTSGADSLLVRDKCTLLVCWNC
jgi:hypothetical protein